MLSLLIVYDLYVVFVISY